MRIVPKLFKCNQNARFFALFVVFTLFFWLNNGYWASLRELVIASSLLPFYGYLALTMGRQYLVALYYGIKRGRTDITLTSMAKKENPRISKVVVKDIARTYAYANRFTNTIILIKKLTETLTKKETEAVLHHEIAHGGFFVLPLRILILICLIPIFTFLYMIACLMVYSVLSFLSPFLNISQLAFVSSLLFCTLFVIEERKIHWASEYKADAKAAEKVGTRTMVSALRKVIPIENAHCDSPTHPSLKRRINRLRTRENSLMQLK